jgi:hypothetical protein
MLCGLLPGLFVLAILVTLGITAVRSETRTESPVGTQQVQVTVIPNTAAPPVTSTPTPPSP